VKVKTKKKTGYGLYTIGSLIEHLQDLVKENNYLDMESPIFISDYNMSGYKHEMDLLPTFSPYLHKAGVCLFHSLGEEIPTSIVAKEEPIEEDFEEDFEEEDVVYNLETETLEGEEEPTVKGDISRFARFIKG
jgi:hypothetical protein